MLVKLLPRDHLQPMKGLFMIFLRQCFIILFISIQLRDLPASEKYIDVQSVRSLSDNLAQEKAAVKIQATFRGYQYRAKAAETKLDEGFDENSQDSSDDSSVNNAGLWRSVDSFDPHNIANGSSNSQEVTPLDDCSFITADDDEEFFNQQHASPEKIKVSASIKDIEDLGELFSSSQISYSSVMRSPCKRNASDSKKFTQKQEKVSLAGIPCNKALINLTPLSESDENSDKQSDYKHELSAEKLEEMRAYNAEMYRCLQTFFVGAYIYIANSFTSAQQDAVWLARTSHSKLIALYKNLHS